MASQHQALRQAVIDELRALSTEIDSFDQAAAERLGRNRTDMRCMDILDWRGTLTAGQLAAAAGLSSGAITTVVDRLERLGDVCRADDPHDRRRVVIRVTEEAGRRSETVFAGIRSASADLLTGYDDAELGLIRDFLLRCRDMVVREAEALRPD